MKGPNKYNFELNWIKKRWNLYGKFQRYVSYFDSRSLKKLYLNYRDNLCFAHTEINPQLGDALLICGILYKISIKKFNLLPNYLLGLSGDLR